MVYMSESKIYTLGGVVLTPHIPYNPLNLPPYTMRFQFANSSYNPITSGYNWKSGSSWTQVSSSPNVWDFYYPDEASWSSAFPDAFTPPTSGDTIVLGGNTFGITSMDNMFLRCTSLTGLALFDTNSVTNMEGMFSHCDHLTDLPLFDTSSVTNMHDMLVACNSLTDVPLFDTSSVTNMEGMFRFSTSLTDVPLFNTRSVTNMKSMFTSCTSLTDVPLFDTRSVTTMEYMFAICSSLTSVPLFDTSSVTNMHQMFSECSSLTTVPLLDTSSVTDMRSMFYQCTHVAGGALALYQQASSQINVPDHAGTFRNCGSKTPTGSAELALIPDDWK